ncbi:hypothetical protein J7438_04885 [Thalassotalea sp. G20_0]|uniref:hypothetical protein n=1 Tax=Thalassotalea sp. G20_0 TaxID=2821093 RepID=UPI001ADA6C0C|nr:hypothetical protein [Thalassotalea sp. G20_0]MBO9493421.1 hypothetical protein [Thalassotalea sp. G20_0]
MNSPSKVSLHLSVLNLSQNSSSNAEVTDILPLQDGSEAGVTNAPALHTIGLASKGAHITGPLLLDRTTSISSSGDVSLLSSGFRKRRQVDEENHSPKEHHSSPPEILQQAHKIQSTLANEPGKRLTIQHLTNHTELTIPEAEKEINSFQKKMESAQYHWNYAKSNIERLANDHHQIFNTLQTIEANKNLGERSTVRFEKKHDKIESILKHISREENKTIIIEKLYEQLKRPKHDVEILFQRFICEAEKPKSVLHGVLTGLCLFSAFGRYSSFILDKQSTASDIIVTLIGSFSTAALTLDAVSAAPASWQEYSTKLSRAQKAFNKCYFPALFLATASDMARVGIASHKEFGLTIAILGTASEGITMLAIGCEALNLLYKAGEIIGKAERCHLAAENILTADLVQTAAIASLVSAYALPLGVEQWTNDLPELILPESWAFSYGAQAAKIIIMSPHALVNTIIETYMTATFLVSIKTVIFETARLTSAFCKKKAGKQTQLTDSEKRISDKINKILTTLGSVPDSRVGKVALAKALLGLACSLTVGSFALYNAFVYQMGLSGDTRERADTFRLMANETRFNGTLHPGVSPDQLDGLAKWADRDATINEFSVGTTMTAQFMEAFSLVKAAGMVFGVGKALYQRCLGTEPMTPGQLRTALEGSSEEKLDEILAIFQQQGSLSKKLVEYKISTV